MTRILIVTATFLLLAGCASGSQPRESSPFGSAEVTTEEQLGSSLFRVTFRGNSTSGDARTIDFNLLRSAEITLKYGFRYFVIVIPDPRASTNTSAISNYTFASAPALTHSPDNLGNFPIAISTFQCFKDKPSISYGKVFNAETLAQTLRQKYSLGK